MRITPEELSDASRYTLLNEIEHENLIPAVQAHLKRSGPVRTAYFAANLLVLTVILTSWVWTGTPLSPALPNLCLGMCLGYLLLMPIHESIHALTYRTYGARNPKVVYNWRTLTAYCVADQFVVDGREFAWVCLMPFLVLNSILLFVLVALGGFRPLLWGMLLLHIGACSGDFAFVNYLWQNRQGRVFTYDDVARERTFFYTEQADGAP